MPKKTMKDKTVGLKGEARLMCVNPDGSLAWKTPWYHNVICNEGFDDYICRGLTATDSAKHLSYMALASGTDLVPNATHITMPQEITNTAGAVTRIGFTVSVSDSKTLRLYATFVSGSDSHFSDAQTLQGIGLYDSSNAGTLFSWLTYATQAVASNQQVNATYQLSFTTA